MAELVVWAEGAHVSYNASRRVGDKVVRLDGVLGSAVIEDGNRGRACSISFVQYMVGGIEQRRRGRGLSDNGLCEASVDQRDRGELAAQAKHAVLCESDEKRSDRHGMPDLEAAQAKHRGRCRDRCAISGSTHSAVACIPASCPERLCLLVLF